MTAPSAVAKRSVKKRSTQSESNRWVLARKIFQYISLPIFIVLFLFSRQDGWPGNLVNLPMHLDPLQAVGHTLAGRMLVRGSILALVTVLFTLVFGRAWCGWICPLGTILDWFPFSKRHTRQAVLPESWRRIKYTLLLITLLAAVLGNLTLLFLDPLAILFRTLTSVVWPVLDRVITATEILLYQVPALEAPISSLDTWLRPMFLPIEPVYYQDILLFALFFLALVAANLLAPRFWCRYLCPLGALLGLFSRIAFFRREIKEDCKGCNLCTASCPTGTIDPEKNYASDPAECTMCMDCLAACPRSQITFNKSLSLADGQAYDPGRRGALFALGTAVGGVALFRSNARAKRQSAFLLRPPGAREANPDVVSLTCCTRCSACIRACPTGGLQPAVVEAGLEGFATPVLVPRLGYCDYSCTLCGELCPVQAIPPLPIAEKRLKVIGKAYIHEDRCIPWSDHQPCVVCEEMCPLPEKAIVLEQVTLTSSAEEAISIQVPHVVRDRCIGCGICEYKCPVSGEAAIRVYIPTLEVPF